MKLVCPPFKGENKGHYSAGVISKGMLYVSMFRGNCPSTRILAKSAKAISKTTRDLH